MKKKKPISAIKQIKRILVEELTPEQMASVIYTQIMYTAFGGLPPAGATKEMMQELTEGHKLLTAASKKVMRAARKNKQ